MAAMITLLFRRVALAATALVAAILPALGQDFGEHSMKQQGPPVENRPKVDEKSLQGRARKNPGSEPEIRSLGNAAAGGREALARRIAATPPAWRCAGAQLSSAVAETIVVADGDHQPAGGGIIR